MEWDADIDRDGSIMGVFPIVTLKALIFICNVCGPTLDAPSELKAAGLQVSINIEDIDPADFYEEPDY